MKKIIISLSVVVSLLVISYIGIMAYNWTGIQKSVEPHKGMSADSSMERVEVEITSKDKMRKTKLYIPKSYFIFARHRDGGEKNIIVLRMYDIDDEFIPWSVVKKREVFDKYKDHSLQVTIKANSSKSEYVVKNVIIPNKMKRIPNTELKVFNGELNKYKRKDDSGYLLFENKEPKIFYIDCGPRVVYCTYYTDYKRNVYYGFDIREAALDRHQGLNKRVRKLIDSFEIR